MSLQSIKYLLLNLPGYEAVQELFPLAFGGELGMAAGVEEHGHLFLAGRPGQIRRRLVLVGARHQRGEKLEQNPAT